MNLQHVTAVLRLSLKLPQFPSFPQRVRQSHRFQRRTITSPDLAPPDVLPGLVPARYAVSAAAC